MAQNVNINFKVDSAKALKSIDGITKNLEKLSAQTSESLKKIAENQRQTINELEKTDSLAKTLKSTFGALTIGLALTSDTVKKTLFDFAGLNEKFIRSNTALGSFSSSLTKTNKVVGSLAKASIVLDKGIFGLAVNTATASAALIALGSAFQNVDNRLTKTIGNVSVFVGVLLGSFSIALNKLILEAGKLARVIGDKVVQAAQAASDKFVEFEQKTFIFRRTIEGFGKVFGKAIGDTESWTNTVTELSSQTGFLEKNLRSAATEIVAATSQMGFSEKEMKKLLGISVDYANQLGTGVVPTTISFIQALNGSAQGVVKYGVKLGAANLQNKLYKAGIDANFQKLKESSKVQVRWNSLLKQYKPIAGSAVASTQTLAGQQKVLEGNLDRINTKFGEGAAIIENSNIANLALNTGLNQVNSTVIKSAGFLTALGGRILQITGFFVEWSLKILITIKVIKVLNILLNTQLANAILNVPIPFFNQSLLSLVKSTGAATVSLNSLSGIIKTVGSVTLATSKSMIAAFLGIEVGALSLGTVIRGVLVKSLSLLKTVVMGVGRALLVLIANPVGATIAAIAAAAFGLFHAFKFIEEQTGALSSVWKVFVQILESTKSVFDPLVEVFNKFKDSIKEFASKVAGRFISGISGILKAALTLITKDPFGVFSENTKKSIASSVISLDGLRKKLQEVDFDIRKLGKPDGKDGEVSIPGIPKKEKVDAAFESLKERIALFNEEQRVLKDEREALESEGSFAFLREQLGAEEALRATARKLALTNLGKSKRAELELEAKVAKQKRDLEASKVKFTELSGKQQLQATQSTLSLATQLASAAGKKYFKIAKAVSLADAIVKGILAVQNALATAPFPLNVINASLIGGITALNVAKIASSKPPSFRTGGTVPGVPTGGRDSILANVEPREAILTRNQQSRLFNLANGAVAPEGQTGVIGAINSLANAIMNQQTSIEIDGRQVAMAVRDQRLSGVAV